MTETPQTRWKIRFSLKTFLIACVTCALIVSWFSNHFREYHTEQQLVEILAETPKPTGGKNSPVRFTLM